MKPANRIRLLQLLLLLTVVAVSASAQSPSVAIIGPAEGLIVNGKAVAQPTAVQDGDRIETGGQATSLTVSPGNELKIAPNTKLVFGNPVNLDCGIVTVGSGSVAVRSGGAGLTLQEGVSMKAAAGLCSSDLPDSPSASQDQEPSAPAPASRRIQRSRDIALAGRTVSLGNSRVTDWSFYTVNGAMLSSSLVSVQLTHDCLLAGSCNFVPDSLQRRRAMLAVGLPAVAGVSYASYYLKKRGYRWWFVPAAIVTAGNVIVSTHAARWR